MAQAADPLPRLGSLRWLAAPSPAARYGLKWGAAAAAIWLGHASGLPQPKWILISVLMVMQPLSGASALKGLLRILGTTVAALSAIAVFGLFSQDPPLLLASVFAFVAIGVYGMTGASHQYEWNVFGFTGVIILAEALSGVDHVETVAFERASLVALGVAIVFVAESVFWPVRVGEQLRRAFSASVRLTGEKLCDALEAMRAGSVPGSPPAEPSPLAQQLQLAGQYRMEVGVSRPRAESAARLATLIEALSLRTERLRRALPDLPRTGLDGPLGDAVGRLAARGREACRDLETALAREVAPAPFARELERGLEAIESQRLGELDERLQREAEHADAAGTLERLRRGATLAPTIRDAVRILIRLEAEVTTLVGPERSARTPSSGAAFWQRRVDPFRLQIALRSALAGCSTLLAMLAFGWPVNVTAIIVTFLAAAAPTRPAGAKLAVGMLAAGLLAWGLADLAIVFLFPYVALVERVPLALAFPFLLIFGIGYLAVARPSFAPLSGLLALLTALPIYAGPAPPTDVEAAYDTAVYLLLAAAVGLIAQQALWPCTATRLFWERVAAQIDLCRDLFEGTDEHPTDGSARGAALAGRFASLLAMLGQLDGQARQEPMNEPEDDAARAAALGHAQALLDAALHLRASPRPDWSPAGGPLPPALEDLRQALERQREAVHASLAWAAERLRGADAGPAPPISQRLAELDDRLESLRADGAIARSLGARLTDATVAHVAALREMAVRQLELEQWLSSRFATAGNEG